MEAKDYLKTQFGNVSYQVFGKNRENTYIALHGWLDNGSTFLPLASYLKNVRIIAIDLPGHGQSDHSNGSYFFPDWVVCLREIVRSLREENVISPGPIQLMGHSMGAAIAMIYSALYPNEVAKFIAFDGLIPLTMKETDTVERLKNYVDALSDYTIPKKKTYESIEDCIGLRSYVGGISKEAARYLVERGTIKNGDGSFEFSSDSRLKIPSAVRLTNEEVFLILDKITCEVCVVVASEGFDFGFKDVKMHLKNKSNFQFRNVEGGHHVHLEAPRDVFEVIKDWV